MKKVLLLDWDTHGEKYYLYFFLKENADVDVWKHSRYDRLDHPVPSCVDAPCFNDYDLLVFPTPYCFTREIREALIRQDYRGRILIEKMVAGSAEELEAFCEDMQKLPDCAYAIIHQRHYTPVFQALLDPGQAEIRWPVSYSSGMDCFGNILPNFLDEYYKCHGILPKLLAVRKKEDTVVFTFERVVLSVYADESMKDCVTVNAEAVPWPDVFSLMPRFMQGLEQTLTRTDEQLAYERSLIEYIEQARRMG